MKNILKINSRITAELTITEDGQMRIDWSIPFKEMLPREKKHLLKFYPKWRNEVAQRWCDEHGKSILIVDTDWSFIAIEPRK